MIVERTPVITIALLLLSATFAATAQTSQHPDSNKTHPPRSQDPDNYIEVIEESGNNRILHYYPNALHDNLRSHQFKVDAGSTLLLRIVPERLNTDAALSNLVITAQLKHGSTSTNVEVLGYSVVGQSQTTGQSQNAVNLNSIANVRAQIENLYFTSHQILADVLPACLTEIEQTSRPYFDTKIPSACQTSQAGAAPGPAAETLKSLAAELTLFTPEINSLAGLFTNPQNAFLGTYFSNLIFGMDLNSVNSVATEFQQAMATQTKQATANQTATNAGGSPAKSTLDPSLWTRVVMIYEDLWTSINEVDHEPGAKALIKTVPITDPDIQAQAVEEFLDQLTKRLVERLKEYLVDGKIVLANYKAVAGDTLDITIEARTPTSGNGSAGSIMPIGITIDNFGVNAGPSTSLFFLKRIAVTAGDLSLPTPITPVTFAPAPGGSFGFTYHYRHYGKCDEPDRYTTDGDVYPKPAATATAAEQRQVEHVCSGNSVGNTAPVAKTPGPPFEDYKDRHPNFMREPSGPGGKFLRALAPGLALNVSFMNWTLPGDYDVTSGKFSTSTAANIQVGAGFVVSLFDNMAQFTYGWNLQVTTRRDYWGLGFGFLEVGKTLGGLIKSKTSTPSQ